MGDGTSISVSARELSLSAPQVSQPLRTQTTPGSPCCIENVAILGEFFIRIDGANKYEHVHIISV